MYTLLQLVQGDALECIGCFGRSHFSRPTSRCTEKTVLVALHHHVLSFVTMLTLQCSVLFPEEVVRCWKSYRGVIRHIAVVCDGTAQVYPAFSKTLEVLEAYCILQSPKAYCKAFSFFLVIEPRLRPPVGSGFGFSVS